MLTGRSDDRIKFGVSLSPFSRIGTIKRITPSPKFNRSIEHPAHKMRAICWIVRESSANGVAFQRNRPRSHLLLELIHIQLWSL